MQDCHKPFTYQVSNLVQKIFLPPALETSLISAFKDLATNYYAYPIIEKYFAKRLQKTDE